MQGGPGPLARSMALFPPRQTDSPIRDSPVPSPDELTASADKSLRFSIGERVECMTTCIGHLTRTSHVSTWQPGVVVRHWYWQGGNPMPYQVSLDNGALVYVPNDTAKVIRALPAEECRNKRLYREGKNDRALTDRQHDEAEATLEAIEEASDVSERGAEPCRNPQFHPHILEPEDRFDALWTTPKAAPAAVLQGGCICRHCRWWRLRDSALAVAQKRREDEEREARRARELEAAAAAEKAEAAARQQRKSAVESTLSALAATAEKTELAAVQQALEAGEALLSRFAADRRIAERETELREAVAAARGRLDELRAARQRERDEKEAARKAAEVERKKAIAARKRAEKEEKEAEAAAIAATNAEVEKAVAEELRLRKAAERKAELDAFAVKVRKRWGERMVRVVCSTEEELTTSGVYNRECPICIEPFGAPSDGTGPGSELWRFPCGHGGHEDCLVNFLRPALLDEVATD